MTIDLKHLRYAEAAERCGSFRKAADSLALKQSNLSRRIRYLEDALGVTLFERTSCGVRATAAGRDFVHGVRGVLSELQIVIDGTKAVGRGEAGYLTIGFYTSLSTGNLRASLVEYGHRFPEVEISTVEGSRSRLFDGIQNGSVDIAVVTGEPASDFNHSMALWSERILVALPENHPLAANEIIYWMDLKRERFLLSERDPGPEIQDILVAKLSSPGDLLDIVRHDVSPENIKSLVGAGRGVSVMCEAALGASYAGVVYREARDGNGSTRIGYRAHWRDGNDNPALRNFIRLLEERCPPVANGNGPRGASSRNPDPSP
ncbi:LysR family transcriptional regulator [Zavarzinia compransoris]|uniref:LysR family transcriptional regulator n=1 Tax=Zavarzinia compransoris TaxID=1264899 RepID=A0A317DYU0_9PROT|nr:LysR family transcriptional regulator [Zavarzinia compransoris]PWR19927.1 LysR family transcriptional regulator [Zavarzinia compransoris]TDP44959.1 DNA-binding transcriptional LysR family regulator [Zavarzinia compransoris]